MFTIGIYPRKSVYRDNSDSVSVQVQLCKDYANVIFKDRDIEFKVYDKDEGFSGKNMNRPSFRELMEDVKNGLLDVVMVYKLDRISRNVQEFSACTFWPHLHNLRGKIPLSVSPTICRLLAPPVNGPAESCLLA